MSDQRPAPLILVVEDDPAIASLVSTALETRGWGHAVAQTGAAAIACAAERSPSVILLDLGLPDMDGIEVVRRVRTWSETPIIVVSARGEDADKIGALDAGADDYLVKPFSVGELLARVRVALRRVAQEPAGAAEGAAFENGALSIDYASGIVRLSGEEVHLTPIEHRLLALLARNEGKVLTHQYLLEHAWGEGQVGDLASLRVIMASLRKKVGAGLIQTHVGVGYRMVQAE
ncbi:MULTISPECIES: response regulator transcription factor [Atopobiaceae]|uniref:response regulator transcription factor n=1 Tax=Atopobiaceae TaxID=1643824 RepID=UPI000B38F630|nr:response regulator transcription factor [Olsenella sp. An285]OUO46643.1 DNA-binding response regulator [Olsenella sp. An285]HIY52282.1 response regulator transcription factor [Candidatus Olsenella avicola]